MKVRNPKDLLAGSAFAGFGVAAILLGRGYSVGPAHDMGPGYFPLLISLGLILLGAMIALRSLGAAHDRIAAINIKPQIFILGAIVFFGLFIETLGLVLCIIGATIISSFAAGRPRWLELAVLSVAVAASSVALFVYGIGQPIPVWPR